MSELLDTMRREGTDKAAHRFDVPYAFFFGDRRDRVKSVLELGIKRGASLRVWESYFPNARIFGVDLRTKDSWGSPNTARIRAFYGGQTDEALLAEVCAAADFGFDLVIDDASHMADDQVASLRYLWPFLRSPGVYVIEDTNAYVKAPEAYDHSRCRYPPIGEMLAEESRRRVIEDVSASPGICVYGGMALLLKSDAGDLPDFDHYLK